jgi:hypothetical protein
MKMSRRRINAGAARRRLRAAAALGALLVLSCQLPVGLHSSFTQISAASISIEVRDSQMPVRFMGTVRVDSGGLRVWLSPPHGGDVFDTTFGVGPATIDQTYASPAAGTWTLSVDSVEGVGRYDLDLGS